MKARHITGITLGSVLAIAALIAPSVPIATQNGSMSLPKRTACAGRGWASSPGSRQRGHSGIARWWGI